MMRFERLFPVFVLGLLANPVLGQDRIDAIQRIDISAVCLYLDGTTLFVGGTDQLRIYDVNDSGNPVLRGRLDLPASAAAITTVGSVAIVAIDRAFDPNLLIVDISNLTQPKILYERRAGSPGKLLTALRSSGRTIFLGVDDEAFQAAILPDDNNLQAISSSIPLDGWPITDIEIVGNRAFVSTWYGIAIVDISDPGDLRQVNYIESLEVVNSVSAEGNILAAGESILGINFYNITNPDTPKLITQLPAAYWGTNEVMEVWLREQFCYAAVLFKPSMHVTEPSIQGGLRIIDIEQPSNPRVIYRTWDKPFEDITGLDVIAFDGHVYLAEDTDLGIFRHGPVGTRPTSTPTPTQTPTPGPTNTPTPTNTPPVLFTPTPRPGEPTHTPTNTPVIPPTHTPITPPTNTPVIPPTNTPTAPAGPTPTLPAGTIQPLYRNSLEGADLTSNDALEIAGTFSGLTPASWLVTDVVPAGGESLGVQGNTLRITVQPGSGSLYLFSNAQPQAVPGKALVRITAWTSNPAAQVFAGIIDTDAAGNLVGTDLGMNQLTSTPVLTKSWRVVTALHESQTGYVKPFVQVAGGAAGSEVYIDNIEVYHLQPGLCYPAELLGVTR